jgi:purine-binding chemotaxis protein CheW
MTERLGLAGGGPHAGPATGRIVFALAEERFALPIEAVEGVAPPPPLAKVPHAAPGLIGAGQLGGRIVPILDLARLLGRQSGRRRYDGSGEVLRLRVAGGSVGLWVDKVERVIGVSDESESNALDGVQLLDPAGLVPAGLEAPGLAAVAQTPLGDVAKLATEAAVRPPAPAYIVVEVDSKLVPLARHSVEELLGTVAWTPVPRAPGGFLGVGLLRGLALPVLSLAMLLGLRGSVPPGGFLMIDVGGRRVLVAVDRIVGLRFQSAESEAAEPVDVASVLPDALRRIVLGFSPDGEEDRPGPMSGEADAYVAFRIGGLECAIPVERVDRVVGPQPRIGLPAPSSRAGAARLEGAIELRGQILPVAGLRCCLGLAPMPSQEPQAYVVLRDAKGLGAIGIDQARQLIQLRRSDIVPAPAEEHGAVAGVVARPDGGLLRIIAPDRLWSGA